MDVEGENPEVSVPKKSRIASLTDKWLNVLVETAMIAMLVNATHPSMFKKIQFSMKQLHFTSLHSHLNFIQMIN